MKMVTVEVTNDNNNGLLWYATGDYNRSNIVYNKGIGKFDKYILPKETIAKYKKYSILTPDFKTALVAATKSCATLSESRKGECLLLVLCSVPQELVHKTEKDKIDIPHIKYAHGADEGIVALFKSEKPSSGHLESSYTFAQLWGNKKWCRVLVKQAKEARIKVKVLPAVQPKVSYNF